MLKMPGAAWKRTRGPGRRLVAGVAVLLVAAGVIVAVADPFAASSPAANGVSDNGAATAITTVKRLDLSQQTQVSATLGYAGASVVAVPAGTAPSNVQQAQQSSASAQSSLQTAQATLASDNAALLLARATLAADRRKLAIDCGGDNAAESGGAAAAGGGSGGGSGPCATGYQAVATDAQNETADTAKVQTDQRAVSSARAALSGAAEALAAAQSSAAIYGQTSVYTALPTVGRVVGLGGTLFAIGGQPVVLLYGRVTPWRTFAPGMSSGGDVSALNENLRALGYGRSTGTAFTAQTAAAIRAFQSAHGLPVTGRLLLGSVVFEPGAVRVTAVTPSLGSTGAGGAGAERHVDPARGHDRARRVAADEREGRRSGHDHAAGQLDHAGTRDVRRHRRDDAVERPG